VKAIAISNKTEKPMLLFSQVVVGVDGVSFKRGVITYRN
jgi:hypothetical protein